MPGETPVNPMFSLDDLSEQIDNYGVDIFPPIEISKETVRAQTFFFEMRESWPYLFQRVTVGGTQFNMEATFQGPDGQEASLPTFNFTPRGPVFTLPRRLSALGGDVDMRGVNPSEMFEQVFQAFLRTFPGRQALRVGLVRNLVFATGQADCSQWLGRAILEFGGAHLIGAQCVLGYAEDDYNIQIQLSPVQLATFTLATGAARLAPQNQFGLSVNLDVNNRAMRPLTIEDARAVLTKANELWPGRLIQLLNDRRLS
jgi:hypothetical protein